MANEAVVKTKEEAINAYLKLVTSKGVDSTFIELRTRYVKKLTSHIQDKPNREAYGKAIQAVLSVEDSIDRQQQLNFAREFYPFLAEDFKAIAKLSATYGFDLTSTKFKTLPTVLDWSAIDGVSSEPLGLEEEDLLSDYALSLKKQNNISEKVIEENVKLVKIVLLTLRDIPIKNNIGYRMAIDVILPLFSVDIIKQQFLDRAREFFYIWIAKVDPEFLNEQ